MNIDEWFKQIRVKYAGQMQCGKGCAGCCYGLFDISLADAADVAAGFQKLAPEVKQEVYARAKDLHHRIMDAIPACVEPTLFAEDDPILDRIVTVAHSPRCPLLDDDGNCRIYENRPLACRLEGVPMVDVRQELFGDWCELNFKDGVSEAAMADLQLDYAHIDAVSQAKSAAVARRGGIADSSAVTFIPSVIVEYASFWHGVID